MLFYIHWRLPRFLLVLTIITTGALAVPAEEEVAALLSLKEGFTKGKLDTFSNWTRQNSKHVCSNWEGVKCEGNNSVVEIHLNNLTLQGTLPSHLGNLSKLKVFSVSRNQLHGIVPSSLRLCNELKILSLGNNNFHGQFPILNSTKLEFLDLQENNFTGELPQSLGKAEQLRVLSLRMNRFTGDLPNWLWNFTKLHIMDLSQNAFQGKLQEFVQLSGYQSVTEEPDIVQDFYVIKGTEVMLKKISSAFTLIDLSHNSFDGTIPVDIGNLKVLRYLNLGGNFLDGELPPELGGITLLEQLDVSANNLTGSLPGSLVALKYLAYFNVSFNNLHGEIPSGGQFSTFDESSYEGNSGLCGFPLPHRCGVDGPNAPSPLPSAPAILPQRWWLQKWWVVGYSLGVVVGFSGVL